MEQWRFCFTASEVILEAVAQTHPERGKEFKN
jgi:hypothetical protein